MVWKVVYNYRQRVKSVHLWTIQYIQSISGNFSIWRMVFSILHIPHYRTPRFRNLACLILKFLHLIETAYLPRYFLTLFDVQFVNGIISTYGLNFFIANTTAKHYFSVTLNFFWQEFNFWENNAIGCSSFWSFNCYNSAPTS